MVTDEYQAIRDAVGSTFMTGYRRARAQVAVWEPAEMPADWQPPQRPLGFRPCRPRWERVLFG